MNGRENEHSSSEESSGADVGIHHYGTIQMGGKDGYIVNNGNGMGTSQDGQGKCAGKPLDSLQDSPFAFRIHIKLCAHF